MTFKRNPNFIRTICELHVLVRSERETRMHTAVHCLAACARYFSPLAIHTTNRGRGERCPEMAMELWKCMRTIRQPGPRATPRAAAKGVFARPRSPLARRAAACGAADHLLSGVRSGLPAACCAACPAQPRRGHVALLPRDHACCCCLSLVEIETRMLC